LGKILLDDSGLINKLAHCHETGGEQSGAKGSGHLVQGLLDSWARILIAAELDATLLSNKIVLKEQHNTMVHNNNKCLPMSCTMENAYITLYIPLLIYLDLIGMVNGEVQHLLDRYQNRRVEYARPGKGEEEVEELRYEHLLRIKSLLIRLTQEQFDELVEELTGDDIGLKNIRCASAHQQVAIFLFVLRSEYFISYDI
jgi:hypothetical protein